jgi:hypothetical protein
VIDGSVKDVEIACRARVLGGMQRSVQSTPRLGQHVGHAAPNWRGNGSGGERCPELRVAHVRTGDVSVDVD